MPWLGILFFISASWAGLPAQPRFAANCACSTGRGTTQCGTEPASLIGDSVAVERDLGFSIPKDDLGGSVSENPQATLKRFVNFLENTAHARAVIPEFYTRAATNASALTLETTFSPKNPTETDEYLRCTLPSDRYCLYRHTLRPYLGLASKVSKIPYSFLACQSYVESRFDQYARSSVGAVGFAQIKETNVEYLNEILKRSIHSVSPHRGLANRREPKADRILKAQADIAHIWKKFWIGTKKAPSALANCDLTCYRQVFLAQALSLKTDMLALVTSSKGLEANFDEQDHFRIENMDPGDSLLLVAGSYNIGVSRMIRFLSRYCHGSGKLKDCLDKMQNGAKLDPENSTAQLRDIASLRSYIMRIRDCSQQYSAEQIDFDDDARWSGILRNEKYNQQRDQVVQCLSKPCPFRVPSSL